MGRHTRHSRAAAGSSWIRLRALLAGGLVLGVGGSLTLAAWTDPEAVQGTFTSGVFDIQGSTDGTNFSSHPYASPAALTFTAGATAMLPGTTVYSAFSLRTTATSVGGNIAINADAANTATGTLGPFLTYELRRVTSRANCVAGFGTGSVSLAAPGSTLSAPITENLALAGAGAVVHYCFAITLPSTATNAAQGQTLSARWTFNGTVG
ncbi:hypothetical protein D9V32_05975 [Mycetocola tolaasinivorans]|uniref:SipW-cognate class signal peptide n=1 Tax=Mycetocola tolaasinivorans TaxID=76635 RepID=A0A3L7A7X5_9MICO|nr:SipW-dependent-type signal peptide-containing protein [Mycetocola tolaasinivorans]RLP76413.1 hypothetical protein D9V32_05975 [Mycetocola tolaasinivorans]